MEKRRYKRVNVRSWKHLFLVWVSICRLQRAQGTKAISIIDCFRLFWPSTLRVPIHEAAPEKVAVVELSWDMHVVRYNMLVVSDCCYVPVLLACICMFCSVR